MGTGTALRSGGGKHTTQPGTNYPKAVSIGQADIRKRKAARAGHTSMLSDNLDTMSIMEEPGMEDTSDNENEREFNEQFAQQIKANKIKQKKKEEAKKSILEQDSAPAIEANPFKSSENPYTMKQEEYNRPSN